MIPTHSEDYFTENFLTRQELLKKVRALRSAGKKIGLCDGSFDLLHPGHMTHLRSAKKYCDILLVALATDRFSQRRKGNGRPIFNENVRAFAVSQLKVVDYVCLVESTEDARSLIIGLHVDYYVRGPDYAREDDPELLLTKQAMSNWGGKIVYTTDEKLSTTSLLCYIQQEVQPV